MCVCHGVCVCMCMISLGLSLGPLGDDGCHGKARGMTLGLSHQSHIKSYCNTCGEYWKWYTVDTLCAGKVSYS